MHLKNLEHSVSVMSEKESLLFLGRSSFWIFKPWLSQFGLSPNHDRHHQPGHPHELNRLSRTNMSWSSRPCHRLHILVMIFKYMSWSWRTCHDLSQAAAPLPLRAQDDNVQWNDQQQCSLTSSVKTNVCTAPMQCVDLITLKNANINIINIQGRSKLMLKIRNIESTARMFNQLWCSAKGFCQCWSEAILDHLVTHLTIVTVTEK